MIFWVKLKIIKKCFFDPNVKISNVARPPKTQDDKLISDLLNSKKKDWVIQNGIEEDSKNEKDEDADKTNEELIEELFSRK